MNNAELTRMVRRLAKMNRQHSLMQAELHGMLMDLVKESSDIADLAPMEASILEVLQDGRPQPGKRIAKLTGKSYSARLRTCLAEMQRKGLIVHVTEGYRLPPQSPQQ